MNQNTFSVIFIILSGLIALVLNEIYDGELYTRYIVIFMIISYFVGRYSVNFPKK